MTFDLEVVTFRFAAQSPLVFPKATAANVFRGALGFALQDVGVYDGAFRPVLETGPSGLADPPRPFVIKAEHLNGLSFQAGQEFRISLHVFQKELVPSFVEAMPIAAAEGLGPLHAKSDLLGVERKAISVNLHPAAEPVNRIGVRFLSATELKQQGAIVARPEFGVLLGRARDRVSTLHALYGGGALELDYAGMRERAVAVTLVHADLQTVQRERRSSKTGQVHPLGGFTGYVEYQGDVAEFWPFLEAAQYTGVGRQTVWGKGAIEVLRLA